MSETKNNNVKFIYLLLFGLATVILGQLFLRIGRGFLFILPFIIVTMGVYLLAVFYKTNQRRNLWKKSIAGKISEQVTYCEIQIKENDHQIKNIESNIQDLEKRLKASVVIPEKTRQQTQDLITGFRQQKELRQTKLAFFQSAIKKLKIILHNHELQLELTQKQQTLKQLQEDNFDTLASLEELKSDLAYHQTYVESIDKLSLRMLKTNNLPNAESLTLELKEMTKELREL